MPHCVRGSRRNFELEGESDNEVRIGQIDAYLLLRGRALNEHESLFEAMDSIDSSVFECYEALFDPESDDWNQSVQNLYGDQISGLGVLIIQSIQLDANYRGKGIGAQVVRETIATFGSHCGLIASKPFPLQYSNWEDGEHTELRKQPGFEEKRLADFARVARFWSDMGFVRLNESDFYTYAPELIDQPSPASDRAPLPVVSRVPRGRRRRQSQRCRVFLCSSFPPGPAVQACFSAGCPSAFRPCVTLVVSETHGSGILGQGTTGCAPPERDHISTFV